MLLVSTARPPFGSSSHSTPHPRPSANRDRPLSQSCQPPTLQCLGNLHPQVRHPLCMVAPLHPRLARAPLSPLIRVLLGKGCPQESREQVQWEETSGSSRDSSLKCLCHHSLEERHLVSLSAVLDRCPCRRRDHQPFRHGRHRPLPAPSTVDTAPLPRDRDSLPNLTSRAILPRADFPLHLPVSTPCPAKECPSGRSAGVRTVRTSGHHSNLVQEGRHRSSPLRHPIIPLTNRHPSETRSSTIMVRLCFLHGT